jgi:hypothetical protein
LIFALECFGPGLVGLHVRAWCDNLVTVSAVTRLKAHSDVLVALLRRLHTAQARWDVQLCVEHIDGVKNVLADALSRNNLSSFFSLLPAGVVPSLVQVPPATRRWLP